MSWETMSGDALQAGLERLGRRAAQSMAAGLCPHGGGRARPTMAALDAEQAAIPVGGFKCSACGQVFDRIEDMERERRERLGLEPQTSAAPARAAESIDRDGAIARIRKALQERSGRAWSVTGGRGTAWGWIHVKAPPRRCTWSMEPTGRYKSPGEPEYAPKDIGRPGCSMSPDDRAELAKLLGMDKPVDQSGESIPASSDYYWEFVDRAEGRTPRVIGRPYWD